VSFGCCTGVWRKSRATHPAFESSLVRACGPFDCCRNTALSSDSGGNHSDPVWAGHFPNSPHSGC
jgi:hypothetical protein